MLCISCFDEVSHLQSQWNPAIMLFDETSCSFSPLLICRVTSAQNPFDFKRNVPNLPLVLFVPCSAVPVSGCCRSWTFSASHLIGLGFLWDCHKRVKESLILTPTESLGSHKGSAGFCKAFYFPLQTPLPAGNQLFYKRRKGAVNRWMWLLGLELDDV